MMVLRSPQCKEGITGLQCGTHITESCRTYKAEAATQLMTLWQSNPTPEGNQTQHYTAVCD